MDVKETKNLILRAKTLQQHKKLDAAQEIYERILKQNPYEHEVLHLMGLLHNDIRKPKEALQFLSRALVITPNLPQLHHNIGLVYKDMGDFESAIKYFQHAIGLNPKYYKAMHKLANAYAAIDQIESAVYFYEKALAIEPKYAEGWEDFAGFSKEQKKYKFSIYCFEQALKYNPDSMNANYGLGSTLMERNQQVDAIPYLKRTLKLPRGNQPIVLGILYRAYAEICDWNHYYERNKKLLTMILDPNNRWSPEPFSPLAYDWSSEVFEFISKRHSQIFEQKATSTRKKLNFQFNKKPKEKLRIGYVSCAFINHPTSQLAYNLYRYHDRNKFEIYCFSHSPNDKSSYRENVKNTCDQFFDLAFRSSTDIAQIIYQNDIDILVDLDGHIRESKLGIAALRPAPIQAHYLGYPGTIGASFFDYLIVDKTVVHPQIRQYYTEKLVYLPHSYQITNDQQEISAKSVTRHEHNLPENAFVFCCFNNAYKIEPKVFSAWMNILEKVPHAVLWLLAPVQVVADNLKAEARKYGIDPERIIFAKRQEKAEHLARHQLADLFLDTLFYNAHTTASDALWAGLPMITCKGVNFASRVGASILTAIDLPELITTNLESYQEKAIYLAHHPQELKNIQTKLQQHRLTKPLFNTRLFVQGLEQGYLKMWENYLHKDMPEDIYV